MVTDNGDVVTGHSVTTANDKAHSEVLEAAKTGPVTLELSLIHISEPTRPY